MKKKTLRSEAISVVDLFRVVSCARQWRPTSQIFHLAGMAGCIQLKIMVACKTRNNFQGVVNDDLRL